MSLARTTPLPSADAIYRPFFKTAIAVVLTLGASWGAYLLIQIALHGSFTAVGIHAVNAHGHAQIFGWVGLFVMGFAYQAFPRFKQTTLAYPRLAMASFWLMVAGMFGMTMALAAAGITQTYLERIMGVGYLETQQKIQVHYLMWLGTAVVFACGVAGYVWDFVRHGPPLPVPTTEGAHAPAGATESAA